LLIGITDLQGGSLAPVLYEIGSVVTHKLYGYRGVVVAYDPQCMAGNTWYMANKTQPPKDQPWYHVLVHESGGLSTYVAQSNLAHDHSGKPIIHPRLDSYFAEFRDGAYRAHSANAE